MDAISSAVVLCPYCGESIELTVDCSIAEQEYIEDCFVCCRPITLRVNVSEDGHADVIALSENEY